MNELKPAQQERTRESLVRQAMRMAPPDTEDRASAPLGRPELDAERWDPSPEKAEEAAMLPDGYLRRSPVQAYRTPEGYRARIIRKAAVALLLLALAVLLVIAAVRNHFFGLLSN